jgi:hypothetical protein
LRHPDLQVVPGELFRAKGAGEVPALVFPELDIYHVGPPEGEFSEDH